MTALPADRMGDSQGEARMLSVSPRRVATMHATGLRLVGGSCTADELAAHAAPGMLADLHEHLRVGANMLKALQTQIDHAERVLAELEQRR